MKTYFCYIHIPGVVTPHLRPIQVETKGDLAEFVGLAMVEWPHFEVIEVYDERDQAILRVARRLGMIDH